MADGMFAELVAVSPGGGGGAGFGLAFFCGGVGISGCCARGLACTKRGGGGVPPECCLVQVEFPL